ncbi:MAG: hypothetical protein AAGF12_09950 [Myxococcota bacterium]
MTGDLRRAAARALAQRGEGDPIATPTRAVLDIEVNGRTETVVVVLHQGEAKVSCTAPPEEEEPYVVAALQMLSAESGEATAPATHSIPPAAEAPPKPADATANALATALSDVVTAIVRVGAAEAKAAPAVNETLEHVIAEAPEPTPLGLARWIGMLKGALGGGDLPRLAWLLNGAVQISQILRQDDRDAEGELILATWLGSGGEPTRLSARTMVEVGREYLAGLGLRAIERRYLVCLATGTIYSEERFRDRPATVSIGPCPRRLAVGLADVMPGILPKRIRLLQYEVSPRLSKVTFTALESVASRSFEALADSYVRQRTRFLGISEPVALVAPAKITREEGVCLHDADDTPLPIARSHDPSYEATLDRFTRGGETMFVAGRLIDARGTLMLVPTSVGVRRGGEHHVLRIA